MIKYFFTCVLILLTVLVRSQNIAPVLLAPKEGVSNSLISQVWYTPNDTPGRVGKYNKMELGFRLDKAIEDEVDKFISKKAKGINPFDPEQIDVSIKLTAPNGETIHTHGFYYVPFLKDVKNDKWVEDTTSFNWRLRFAPDQIGEWKGEVLVKTQNYPTTKITFSFKCEASTHKGILKISNTGTVADRYLYESETGNTFFPMGHNISTRGKQAPNTYVTPVRNDLHKKWIQQLADNGGNFFRMEMPIQSALPDWPVYNNYKGKLDEMYGYDEVVNLAEIQEMYFIMFRHHVEVGGKANWGLNWDCWENNPYKKAFNLTTSEAYFKNKEIIKWQKNSLRYIMARWGYSPSFAFYGYSEANVWMSRTELEDDETYNLFADWYIEMKNYIKNELHFLSDLFVCSFTSGKPILKLQHPNSASRIIDASDIISLHSYSYKKSDNFRRVEYVNDFLKEWGNEKPILLEETGIEANQGIFCCTGINFHNTIWASSFSGTMGSGMHWNWDRGVHSKEYFTEYKNLNAFFKGEDFTKMNYLPQRWKNDVTQTLKNATLENYTLVSEKREKALGWIHNATYYWRNLSTPCIQELVDSNGVLLNQCPNEDNSHALGTNVHGYTYNNKEFTDRFTKKGGAQTILKPVFIIKGLKANANRAYNPWAKKHWYKVSYYATHGEVNDTPVKIEVLSTNIMGKLKLYAPDLTNKNPDYSYKVEYLGFRKKKEVYI